MNTLPTAIEKEACQGIFGLSKIDKLKLGNLRGRLEVLENFVDEVFLKISDNCFAKLVLSRRFSVTSVCGKMGLGRICF